MEYGGTRKTGVIVRAAIPRRTVSTSDASILWHDPPNQIGAGEAGCLHRLLQRPLAMPLYAKPASYGPVAQLGFILMTSLRGRLIMRLG
jgi:hypothetical protein